MPRPAAAASGVQLRPSYGAVGVQGSVDQLLGEGCGRGRKAPTPLTTGQAGQVLCDHVRAVALAELLHPGRESRPRARAPDEAATYTVEGWPSKRRYVRAAGQPTSAAPSSSGASGTGSSTPHLGSGTTGGRGDEEPLKNLSGDHGVTSGGPVQVKRGPRPTRTAPRYPTARTSSSPAERILRARSRNSSGRPVKPRDPGSCSAERGGAYWDQVPTGAGKRSQELGTDGHAPQGVSRGDDRTVLDHR